MWEEKIRLVNLFDKGFLSAAFSYARYSKVIEKLTNFGLKVILTLPSLANKYFNSLRDENGETIYTCHVEVMRFFVRQSIQGGRCGSFNQ